MEPGFLSGQLLIAMPGIGDPRFERALILICAHDATHAMGLALNRPVGELTAPELFAHLKIETTGEVPPDQILLGGPVARERGFVLHSRDYRGEDSLDVTCAEGLEVSLTATRDVLQAIAGGDGGPARSLFALGYAGWGEGQLETEIKANVWLTCEADAELIFDHDYETKWTRALAKLGVDPQRLSGAAGRA